MNHTEQIGDRELLDKMYRAGYGKLLDALADPAMQTRTGKPVVSRVSESLHLNDREFRALMKNAQRYLQKISGGAYLPRRNEPQ